MAYNPWQTFTSNMGRQAATLGTLFSAPEMRISESLGRTGSFGQNTYNPQTPSYASQGGQVLGTTNNQNMSTQPPMSPAYNNSGQSNFALPTQQSNGGGGGNNNTLSGFQPSQSNFDSGGMTQQAQNQAQIELEQALGEFDYQAEQGQNQIGALQSEQASTLSGIDTMRGRVGTEASTAKTDAESSTMKEKSRALGTAQDVQKDNRNILRALGILSSSAAGEMLTKPMNEYASQAADLGGQLVKRKQQVDDWLMQRNQDFDTEVSKVKQQYQNMIQGIQTDLRFNDRQRATAVKAASSALQTKLGEINAMSMQYKQAAQEYNNGVLDQIAQLMLYQNPNADMSSIINAKLSSIQGPQQTQQVGVAQSDEQRRRLSGLG